MIQTAIGLPSGESRTKVHDLIQNKLVSDYVQTYNPHLMFNESTNISVEFNYITGGLDWKKQTIDYVKSLPYPPMVFSYGDYFYGGYGRTTWRTVRWPSLLDPSKTMNQDELSFSQLSYFLSLTREWFDKVGIKNPWIFVDEPPHKADDGKDGTKYGWSLETENRIIKFISAAIEAKFDVGVAIPGPSQLRFWVTRIRPTFWILNEKHTKNEYISLPPNSKTWLYNARSYDNFGERLVNEGHSGYLLWSCINNSAKSNVPNLFKIVNDTFEETEHYQKMLLALKYKKPKTLEETVRDLQNIVIDHENRIKILEKH